MIKEFRKQYKLTQQELADMTHVSRSYLSDIERGKTSQTNKVKHVYRFIELYKSQYRQVECYGKKSVAKHIVDFFASLLGVRQ